MTDYEKAVFLWKKRNIKNDAELAEALNGFGILFAYNSGKIENEKITYNDTREIFDKDSVSSYTGDLRTLFEIRNAKSAYELFLTSFNEKKPIEEELIKDFHRELTQSTYDERRWKLGERPGEYKHHDYVTGREEIGALPEDVRDEMNELIEEIQCISEENALTVAAYFHVKFENIHPFADGNGRTGRLIMNYILTLYNHPPIIIHEEDRKEYYSALEKWDTEQKLSQMCEFLKQQTVKTWQKQIERYKNQ